MILNKLFSHKYTSVSKPCFNPMHDSFNQALHAFNEPIKIAINLRLHLLYGFIDDMAGLENDILSAGYSDSAYTRRAISPHEF